MLLEASMTFQSPDEHENLDYFRNKIESVVTA